MNGGRRILTLVVCASLIAACGKATSTIDRDAARDVTDSWLTALMSHSGDLGWSLLDSRLKADRFGDDPAAYREAVLADSHPNTNFTVMADVAWDDEVYSVFVRLADERIEAVPSVLVDEGLAGPWYDGSAFAGLVVLVSTDVDGEYRILGGPLGHWPDASRD